MNGPQRATVSSRRMALALWIGLLGAFSTDATPFGAANLLSLIPLQGAPLRPTTRYAAVVLRRTLDAAGKPLGVSLEMATLAAGSRPAGLGDAAHATYRDALATLAAA